MSIRCAAARKRIHPAQNSKSEESAHRTRSDTSCDHDRYTATRCPKRRYVTPADRGFAGFVLLRPQYIVGSATYYGRSSMAEDSMSLSPVPD